MKGVKVGIAKGGEETVGGVLCAGRQVENALEQEVEVWIGCNYSAFESIFTISSGGRNVGVIVIERLQAFDV